MSKKPHVEPLRLKREGKPKTVKVTNQHGTALISIPKKWMRELGITMSSEVVIEKRGNPIVWEIRIKPYQKSTNS